MSDVENKLLDGLLPEQKDIVTTLDRPVFVAAGAGSGKTFTLTRRIVWALTPGSAGDGAYLNSIDQALIITFTEKAAGEIKERVRSALRAAGMEAQALEVDNAWISTIHHMCSRILRSHALDLGLDPAFTMIGEQTAQVLRAQAIDAALTDLDGDAGIDALFAEYSAGTGAQRFSRSNDVLSLLNDLLNKAGSATYGLDSLEFCNAACDFEAPMRSLTEGFEALCTSDSKYEDEVCTCRRSLSYLREFWELAPGARTLDVAAEVLDNVVRPNGTKWGAKAVKDIWKETCAALELAKAEVALGRAQALQAPLMKLARTVDRYYAALKLEHSMLDNDDLLQLTARAFREHPEIAAEYANKFKLVMVDEFQDTNDQQVNMVKGLSGKDACHLTTVGDAQQAIYGFRGADVRVFENRGVEAEQDPDALSVKLDYNFRSDDAILRFVASVCGKTEIVPAFMDLRVRPNRESAFPESKHPRVVVEFTRASSEAGRKSVPRDSRTALVAAQIVDRLAQLHAQGIEPKQMAVLMRTLKDANVFIDALRARGLDSVVTGGSTFAEAPEVQIMAALLHVLANPQDTQLGLFPVLSSPMFALDADDMLLLATKQQEVLDAPAKRRIYPGARMDAVLFGGAAGSERLQKAREVLARAWQRVGKQSIADVVLAAVCESGWLARLEGQGVEGRAIAANILMAIRHIRELTEKDAFDAALAVGEFDGWLSAAKEGPASLSGEGLNAVSIMTAHASKGLEFDVVAVVGCCGAEREHAAPKLLGRRNGEQVMLSLAPATFKLPAADEDAPVEPKDCHTPLEWRQLMEAEAKEADGREDGRLLYVALTRARECVILSLDCTKTKSGLSPKKAGLIADTLFAGDLPAGESSFEYGGARSGLVRAVDIVLLSDAEHVAFAGHDGLDLHVFDAEPTDTAPSDMAQDHEAFDLYNIDTSLDAPLSFWRPREGVFSYSSAHGYIAASSEPVSLDDILALPLPLSVSEAPTGFAAQEQPEQGRLKEPLPTLLTDDEQAALDGQDGDRATNLGSAFHELARYMVETGKAPVSERIEIVGRNYGVTKRDIKRLSEALARWEHSELRAEALTYQTLRAEVPFFCSVESPLGHDLEGAIDLLATNGPDAALLIDYKTGDHNLTYEQICERHEMQARFYAYVLSLQGYSHIECAFVCVELEDAAGQPVVVHYVFS